MKTLLFLSIFSSVLSAENNTISQLRLETDILWTCIAAFLVFLMQAGFAFLEAGFTRSKNVVAILLKNLADLSIGSIFFWLIGFSIMFGPLLFENIAMGTFSSAESLLQTEGKNDNSKYAFFLFQLMFCATAATIVSGAMAERAKFSAYLIYSAVISAIIYPVFGSMTWAPLFMSENSGLLSKLGFLDFAGSTVVHSLGAWIGLAGTLVLGPRIGRYTKEGTVVPVLGHNMAMSALGALLLWFGWYGFNAGSTTSVGGGDFAFIAVTTTMAATAGAIGAMLLSWLLFKKPDITMVINGALAGLVAITAPCNNVTVNFALLIGFIAGLIVVGGVLLFDYLRIDDPVGAISVHGLAGAWGTISIAFFANPQLGDKATGLVYGGGFELLGVQALGIGIAFFWAFGTGYLLFKILKHTIGLRIDENAELEGLDIAEHSTQAYPIEN